MDTTIDKETISLRRIIVGYLHHWKLFLFFFILSTTLAIAYLVLYPTTYEIMARIQLQEDKELGSGSLGLGEAAGLMKSFGLGSGNGSSIMMDDELAKLLSNDLLTRMVTDLGLHVSYKRPYSYNYEMYENVPVLLTPDSLTNEHLSSRITFRINIDKQGKVRVDAKSDNKKEELFFDSLPADIDFEGNKFTLSYKNVDMRPYSQDVVVSPATWIAEDLAEELIIEEYSKSSNVIEFTYRDYETQRGMDMLNLLMNLYNKQESGAKKKEGLESITFLDSRIEGVISDLNKIESMIEQYKTKHKMTDIEFDVPFYAEQMKDLRSKIIEVEAQSRILVFMDEYIKDPRNKYNLVPSLLNSSEGGDKGNPIALYNEALLEREKILQTSKNDNPLIGKVNKQVDQLRASVFLSIENAKKSSSLTLLDLRSKEKAILDKMESVPSVEKEYVDFKLQQEIYQAVYLILLQKREEIALSINNQRDRARIIDAAFVKQRPVAPRKLFAVLGILAFTLILPVGVLFIKEQFIALKSEFNKR